MERPNLMETISKFDLSSEAMKAKMSAMNEQLSNVESLLKGKEEGISREIKEDNEKLKNIEQEVLELMDSNFCVKSLPIFLRI